jgi:hypothetical protein
MHRFLLLAALVPGLASAAIPTRAVGGKLLQPDGTAASSGAITCTLSQAGSVLDGSTWQRVAGQAVGTVAADGTVAMSLTPNDVVSPSGTAYSCSFSTRATSGRPVSWTETWSVVTGSGSIDIGAITRVATGGVTYVAGPVGATGPTGPAGASGVAAATAPVTYDSGTQTVGFNSAALDASTSTVTATGGTSARSLAARAADVVNVKDFGASGSAQTTTGSITTGTNLLTVASAIDFAVGQGISVAGAGAAGALLVSSVTAINGLVLTLAGNAGTSVTGAVVKHDDTAAIQAALTSVQAGGTVFLPDGYYRVSSTLSVVSNPAWSTISIAGPQLVYAYASQFAASTVVLDSSGITTTANVFNCTGNNSVSFRGFTLYNNSASYVTQIDVYYATLTIRDMLIEGGKKGVRAQYATLLISNSHITLAGTATGDYAVGIAGSTVEIRGSTLANSGPPNSTNLGGNLYAFSPASELILDSSLVDEGGGASLDLEYISRASIRNARVYLSKGGYGIRIGANATNVLLDHVRVEPFSVDRIPVNTILAAGSGHKFINVSTNPNGGGDISDTSTDPVYENVNGQWKYPTTDASGTPGNATINKASGKVAIAGGGGTSTVTVTNNLVTAASIVTATMQATDATCTSIKSVVPTAGSFTVTANANCTAATKVAFTVQN